MKVIIDVHTHGLVDNFLAMLHSWGDIAFIRPPPR